MADTHTSSDNAVELDGKDLPAFCPNPKMPIWSGHPRVFIDLLKNPSGEAACPYCGTQYRFTGERPKGHH